MGRRDYRPRTVDAELAGALAAAGAVLLEGPRGCGKTATARQAAASEVRFDTDANARQAALVDPTLILDGPVLFTGWTAASPAACATATSITDASGTRRRSLLQHHAPAASRTTSVARLIRLSWAAAGSVRSQPASTRTGVGTVPTRMSVASAFACERSAFGYATCRRR